MDLAQKDFGSITVGKIKETLILGNPETKTVHTKLCVFFTGQRLQRTLRSVTKIAFCRCGRIDPNICSIDNNAGIDIPDTSALFVSLLSSVSSQTNLVKS